MRHVRIGHLWVQEARLAGDLKFGKVIGTGNPADLLTKHLPANKAAPLVAKLYQGYRKGGAENRLQLRPLGRSDRF